MIYGESNRFIADNAGQGLGCNDQPAENGVDKVWTI
jgi:hypothetical protein